MFYAMKLGPIATTEGEVHAYFASTPDGLGDPVMAASDGEGLRALLAAHPGFARTELRCEKPLFKAGKPLGFTLARPDQQALYMKASLAMLLALGESLDPRDPRALVVVNAFAGSTAAFFHAEPWQRWDDSQILSVEVRGLLEHTFEAVVLGAAGEQFGLALYASPGGADRVADAMRADDFEAARREDHIAFTYDDEPEFAAEALNAAIELPVVPLPTRLRGGQVVPITALELLVLVHAVAGILDLLEGDGDTAEVAIPIDGDQAPPPLSVTVRVVSPEKH